MEQGGTLEMILVGALVVLLVWWMAPGIKRTFERSREAKADWQGLLLPIGAVVLFVILLIAITRG